jgi:murein DD-endopeptidase MepM/ murein hydrolase activator NlpD
MKIALLLLRVFSSFKTEVKIVLISLGVLLTLPLFMVLIMANSGLALVASAFAALNPVTHLVEVRNPKGEIIAQLTATTAWPVRGYVSEEFGVPHLPWQKTHTGIDVANPLGIPGDPVTPFIVGKVIIADDSEKTGWGKYVVVDHGNSITSLYGHLSAVNVVKDQEVKPGDTIGLEGSTGHSTGSHVHFEIRVYGVPVNPRVFMVGDPIL